MVGRRRPEAYIAGQLKAIVGVEIVIDRVEGKTKLSQNRSDADIAGAIEGSRLAANARSQAETRAPMRIRPWVADPAIRARSRSRPRPVSR